MTALDKAIATAHAQLLQARKDLAQSPMRSFQDAFIEALRGPYEAAALAQQTSSSGTSPSGKTRWRRVDLRSFLTSYFPQYAQQPAAFAALCASLSAKAASVGNREGDGKEENEKSTETDDVMVTFDALKRVLVRQYCSTRLLAKDPFPLEACVETKRAERRPSVAPFVAGSSGDESGPGYATSLPELREFQADVMKKSQSWLGRWRARHLVLKWGTLEMHKRSLAARSFRHVHSSASSSGTFISDGSGSISSSGISTAGTTTKTTKTYDLCDLVSLKLEQLSDGDSVRKAALTLQFQTLLTPSSNSHSNPTATASHDIKTLMLGGGGSEVSDLLVGVRDHVATFALLLELSRRDHVPSMTRMRRFVDAGAQVNVRVNIPRVSLSRDSREGQRRKSRAGKPLFRGTLTALQLAFLQDPRAPGFEGTIALLLNAGADPRCLLCWEYATSVFFPPPLKSVSSDESKEAESDEHLQRRILRKNLLLRDTIESDGGDKILFPCGEVQADDGVRWNLLMYLCWHNDLESVQQLLNVTGAGVTQGNQGRMSNRLLLTCLDHVNVAGDTALHIAIKTMSEPVALLLVEAALSSNAQAVHQCDARGEPVVHLALTAHQWRVVDALVAGGAVDPRSYDALGNTALHLAIQLRAPVALVARLIQVYRHSPQTGGLDGRSGRRGSNDTSLSLALKSGQQEVVALLLAAGASPAGSGCQWSTAFREKRGARGSQNAEIKEVVSDDDNALHVAIKAGMELAAAALIAHKADIHAVDSRGASSLALAVRYGLYALAAALAEQHQKKHKPSSSKQWWVDGETGRPVAMLAIQAGQLELAALLLDYNDQDSDRQLYPSRLLSLLAQIYSWLHASPGGSKSKKSNLSRRSSGRIGYDADRKPGKQKTKVRSSSSNSIPLTLTRKRIKSRSDGDWKYLQRESSHRNGELSSDLAQSYEEPAQTIDDKNECAFLLHGIQALVLRFLQISDKTGVVDVVGGGETPSSGFLSTLPLVVHLPTTMTTSSIPPKIFKDDELAATSPLHAAATGGNVTSSLLRWFLAFLLSAEPSAAAQALVRPVGSRAETPLHAAITAGAAENALLLLYSSRELQARSATTSSLCAHLYEMPNLLGDSALHLASAWPRSAAMHLVIELLLQENVTTENWSNAGLAPLHVALRHACDNSFIELFLRYRQDLNVWSEGSIYQDEGDPGNFFETNTSRPSVMALITSCPQNPLMFAIQSENYVAFHALVRGGARTRALMPRARIGLLQLAVHCNVCDPELLACMLNDPELEQSAQSNTADQWGVSPRDARSRLMEVWRRERSGDSVDRLREDCCSATKDILYSREGTSQQQQAPPLHPAFTSGERLPSKSSSSEHAKYVDSDAQPAVTRAPSPLRITVPGLPPSPVPLETAQYLRALPRPPTLSSTTLEYLREEERATLTLVAQEARSEAQDWLAKRIGQKKLLSDAHAQLQNAKKHRRSASGSSVNSSKDGTDTPEATGRYEYAYTDHQLLEELKAYAAKKFIDKHVAEVVAEARLVIEREKQTIFQETGLYPGVTSASKKSRKKSDGKPRSLLVRAASSTTGSMLLPASSASVTSMSSEEGNPYQLNDDSYGNASFWWSERGTAFLSDESNLTWLSASGSRGGTMLSDSTAVGGGPTRLSNGRGTVLEGRDA